MNYQDIQSAIKLACEACGVDELAKQITFRFSNRMTRAAGHANYRTNILTFSTIYWNRATIKDVKNTVYHEICHLITWYKHSNFRPKPHGRQWQHYMYRCNQRPTRTHNTDMGPRQQRSRIVVYCGCESNTQMGPVQYKRLVRFGTKYKCRTCGQRIRTTP